MLNHLLIKAASDATQEAAKRLLTKRDALVAAGTLGTLVGGKRVAQNMAIAERMRAHDRAMRKQQRKAEGKWF